jgi:sec-independent protein translocase protein TatC
MIVASIATPDWSPVTMLALFAAMLVLYEGALLTARVTLRKRIAAEKAAEA